MRISDWSSDVCSSDLPYAAGQLEEIGRPDRVLSLRKFVNSGALRLAGDRDGVADNRNEDAIAVRERQGLSVRPAQDEIVQVDRDRLALTEDLRVAEAAGLLDAAGKPQCVHQRCEAD